MIFKLFDENSNTYKGEISLNFKTVEEYLDWHYSDEDFAIFMDKMETEHNPWCGVHDGANGFDDGVEFWCYSSYEIVDFTTALEKWKDFFISKGKILQ